MSEISQDIDNYITGLLGPSYRMSIYSDILAAAHAGGLPAINISASEGQLLHVLARTVGARRILEVGTLGGYSGTWLATALPSGGRLISLEINVKHAEVAQANFERAGLVDKVQILVGPASESLDRLIADKVEPFDLAFIDADKDGYVEYLRKCLQLVRKGGLILGDNTLSHGVLEGNKDSGIARYNAAIARERKLISAMVATMRDDIDGLTISVVE